MNLIKRFTRRVNKLFRWIPLIWKDEDWDYEYLLKVMQFKLEGMAELHVKQGDAMNSKLYASEMLHASHLLLQATERDFNDEEQQKDIDKAFTYITENMTKWWD